MEKENLIKELKKYLDNINRKYYSESIAFKGLRKDVPQPDGGTKDLYAVSFMVSVNDNKFDSDAMYNAYFEPVSEKLLYIIGPQSYEKVE